MKVAAPGEPELTFRWDEKRGVTAWLPVFFAASLFAHAATFFVFQVIYPQRAAVPPPAPRVSVLLPSLAEHRPLLGRIEAEDPALGARSVAVEPPGLLAVPFRPSFEVIRTAPRLPPESPRQNFFPPARPALAIIRSADPQRVAQPTASEPQATRVSFRGAIADRVATAGAPLEWKAPATAPIEPAEFLLGINDRGEVRFVFVQRPSGDAALDDEAAAHLRRLSFTPGGPEFAWGFATFHWGDDAYAAAASATSATR